MSKKYVIEIKPEYEDSFQGVMLLGAKDSTLYVDTLSIEELEELNSDYINTRYGELQDEAYKRGLSDVSASGYRRQYEDGYRRGYKNGRNIGIKDGMCDAWEAAKKIVANTDNGGIAARDLCEIFGTRSYCYIMQENTAQEAIDKIKAYEDGKHSDRIEVGDEVATETGKKYTVVSFGYDGTACGFDKEGVWTGWNPKEVTKTGRHFDIASMLEAMRQ